MEVITPCQIIRSSIHYSKRTFSLHCQPSTIIMERSYFQLNAVTSIKAHIEEMRSYKVIEHRVEATERRISVRCNTTAPLQYPVILDQLEDLLDSYRVVSFVQRQGRHGPELAVQFGDRLPDPVYSAMGHLAGEHLVGGPLIDLVDPYGPGLQDFPVQAEPDSTTGPQDLPL